MLTILLGIVFYWYMPDNQLNARWMSEADRILAVHRIRGNQQGIGNKHFKRYQLVEALRDPMSWAFTFYACVTSIGGGGLSGFFSQMVSAVTRVGQVVADSSIGQSTGLRHSGELPSGNSCRRGVKSNLRWVRLFGWQVQEATPNQQHRPLAVGIWDAADGLSPYERTNRQAYWLLPLLVDDYRFYYFAELDRHQCCRLHEKDNRRGNVPHWLLRRVYHWPPDVQSRGCSTVSSG